MKLGASSACFYPLQTEKSVAALGELGFKTIEIFFNAECELCGSVLNEIKSICAHYGMNVVSVHPFTSFAESNMLFSPYERRFEDFAEFYKKYYHTACELGAKTVVLHGCKSTYPTNDDLYIERFAALAQNAAESGVVLAQENVFAHKSSSPEFLCRMKAELGSLFSMVFDVKQAFLSGYDPIEFAERLGSSFVHLHLSDHSGDKSCMPPGKGNFDFEKLLSVLRNKNYGGAGVIELYSNNFSENSELIGAYNYLKQCGF